MTILTTQRAGTFEDIVSGTMPWTALTGAGAGGVPGDGDVAQLAHNVAVGANQTVGIGAPTEPYTAPTINLATGAGTTNLPTGTYRVAYSWVDSGGRETSTVASVSTGAMTNGVSLPRVTIPALPTGVASANIYLTNTSGADGTQRLYASGVTGTTYDLISASWTNGTTTYAAAAARDSTSGKAIRLGETGGAIRTLTLNAGVSFTAKGDLFFHRGFSPGPNELIIGAGATWTFKPPSGQQYGFRSTNSSTISKITANGTVNSRATIQTDKSLSGLSCITDDVIDAGELMTFALGYTNIIDFGTTTTYGIRGAFTARDCSVTNCNFTRTNLLLTNNTSGTFTFSDNVFDASIMHAADVTSVFLTRNNATGTTAITDNGFDSFVKLILVQNGAITCTGNVFGGGLAFSHGATYSTWTSSSTFSDNIAYMGQATICGPISRLLYIHTDVDNPHFISFRASTVNALTDCFLEAPNYDAGAATDIGDAILGSIGTSLAITGCISLANVGVWSLGFGANTCPLTFEHNTSAGPLTHSETSDSATGQVVSFKSNLIFDASHKILDRAHAASGGIENIALPANIVKNAGYQTNNSDPSDYVGNTYTHAGLGYQSKFSSQPGLDDIYIASGDPLVDRTMETKVWCQDNYATDGTITDAMAHLAANPSLATATIDGVRNAYKVTGSSGLLLKDAGHDGVTIGAMEYSAGGSGSTAATLLAIGVI